MIIALYYILTIEREDVVQHEILDKVKRHAAGGVVGVDHLVLSERRVRVRITAYDLRPQPRELLVGTPTCGGPGRSMPWKPSLAKQRTQRIGRSGAAALVPGRGGGVDVGRRSLWLGWEVGCTYEK